ncbi:MAG: isoprenyl transferase [Planctomycetota bacterium]|nr:isoprenyl transferase [Planctomycetota bacterium]
MTERGANDDGVARAEACVRARVPGADPRGRLPDVHPGRIPRHIAIIMDGNGRWAKERGFPRSFGHRNGARVVREVLEECGQIGVEFLTLYSFSVENWSRPREEVEALMALAEAYFEGEREHLAEKNVRVRFVGRREGMPESVLRAVDGAIERTRGCTGVNLCIAMNYGSRAEIVDAVRSIAADAAAGKIAPEAIDDRLISSRLYTADIPDPDLLIRTAGEMRVSNFLLWQISYAEIYVTETLWPDFTAESLHGAIRAFARRNRTFGGRPEATPPPSP